MYVYKKKPLLILFSIIDLIGGLLFVPVRWFRRKRWNEPKRILLIRLDHIGDVVNVSSVLELLRKTFPDAVIDFMAPVWAYDLYEANPFIDHCVVFDAPWFSRKRVGLRMRMKAFIAMIHMIKQGRYDAVVDLRGDFRHIAVMFAARVRRRVSYGITGGGFLLTDNVPYHKGVMHETERNRALLKVLGVEEDAGATELCFPEHDRIKADEIKEEYGIKGGYAIIHPVPGHSAKIWNDKNFAEVICHICEEKGLLPVLVGAIEDRDTIESIIRRSEGKAVDLSGKTSLGVLGSILSNASLFVGVDSGPSHIAAAAGTPTVIVFSGTNDPAQWAPKGPHVQVVCSSPGNDLSDVSVDRVCRAVDRILSV